MQNTRLNSPVRAKRAIKPVNIWIQSTMQAEEHRKMNPGRDLSSRAACEGRCACPQGSALERQEHMGSKGRQEHG